MSQPAFYEGIIPSFAVVFKARGGVVEAAVVFEEEVADGGVGGGVRGRAPKGE